MAVRRAPGGTRRAWSFAKGAAAGALVVMVLVRLL